MRNNNLRWTGGVATCAGSGGVSSVVAMLWEEFSALAGGAGFIGTGCWGSVWCVCVCVCVCEHVCMMSTNDVCVHVHIAIAGTSVYMHVRSGSSCAGVR